VVYGSGRKATTSPVLGQFDAALYKSILKQMSAETVIAHGGRISVDETPGGGATFRLRIG